MTTRRPSSAPVPTWCTSRHSNGGDNCVQWAPYPDAMMLRDSKDPDGPVITIDRDQWPDFLTAALTGGAVDTGAVVISTDTVERTYRGVATTTVWHLHCRATGVALHFTAGERDAFLAAVRDARTIGTDLALAPAGR